MNSLGIHSCHFFSLLSRFCVSCKLKVYRATIIECSAWKIFCSDPLDNLIINAIICTIQYRRLPVLCVFYNITVPAMYTHNSVKQFTRKKIPSSVNYIENETNTVNPIYEHKTDRKISMSSHIKYCEPIFCT